MNDKKHPKTISLSPGNIRDIDLLSRFKGISFSHMIDQIIAEYLSNDEIQQALVQISQVLVHREEKN